EGEEREAREPEARRERGPSEADLDAATEVPRERQREEGCWQGEPPVFEHAREESVGRDARGQEDDRAEEPVHRLDRRTPEENDPDRCAQDRESRRVELELRIATPPVGIPGG